MIPGYSAVVQHPVEVVPDEIDASVPTRLRAPLKNPDGALLFLLIAEPGAAIDTDPTPPRLLLSNAGWQSPNVGTEDESEWGDTTLPANRNFPPRLTNAYNYEARIPAPAGGSEKTSSIGTVEIENSDGELDEQMALLWGGQPIEIKLGQDDYDYDEFESLFKGKVADVEWSESKFTINLQPGLDALTRPLPVDTYAGTGGLEGGASLQGVPRPLCWGQVRNIAPVLVDSTNRIFQIHDGTLNAVQSVRDNGSALTFDADYADITTATPAAGTYATSLATGYIRVGSLPSGLLTADVQGDYTNSYPDTAPGIVQRILFETMGYADAIGLGYNNLATYTLGYYTGSQSVTAASIFDALLGSVGGWWLVNPEGRVDVGAVSVPTAPLFTFTASNIAAINRIKTPQPVRSWRVGYERTWAIQSADGLAAAVTAANRDKYSTEYRYQTHETVAGIHLSAQELVADTLIDTATDAAAEALRRHTRDNAQRDIYRLTTFRHDYQIVPGNVVRIEYDRFGLDAGRDFAVIGVVESSKTRTTGLVLWG